MGGNRTLAADVRWVAATNCDLDEMVRDGSFREDLFHRLAVFPVRIPPLRERREEILPLAEVLLRELSAQLNRPTLRLADGAKAALASAPWPGNVRQLRNVLERAAILCEGAVIDEVELPATGPAVPSSLMLENAEREAIVRALAATQGNRRRAAKELAIGLRTLYEKIKRYGL